MRNQRIITAVTRFVADQFDRINSAVACVIACASHLRHGQMYLGMPPCGGKPSLGGLERCREWLGTDSRSLWLAIADA